MAEILYGDLVVNEYSVPLVRVDRCDLEDYVFLTLDGRLAFTVRRADFWHIAELVANAIAIGMGLPCHPSEGTMSESMQRQLERIHCALRPVKCVQVGSAPSLTLVKR